MSDIITTARSQIAEHIDAIQQPRPEWVLRHEVVGQHDTEGQQWAQCVLEAQNKLTALETARIERRIAEVKIEALEGRLSRREALDAIRRLKADKMRLELKQLEWAELGAARELRDLLTIKAELEQQHDGRGWTRQELDDEQPEYWRRRLTRQALQDINATGRIQVGQQDALRRAGLPVPGQPNYIQQVEQRFLEPDQTRLLIATPTQIPRDQITEHGLQCLQGWTIPNTITHRFYVIQGKTVAEAYTDAALTAMSDGATHLLCVEDDHVIPAGTFERLWNLHLEAGPRSIVGAWYPQRAEPRTGAPVVLVRREGTGHDRSESAVHRQYLTDDGSVHEVYTIPQGFTIIPVSVFRELPQPWFVTTDTLTQDSFFSQLAREAGYTLLVDTAARIQHVDRTTGTVYE